MAETKVFGGIANSIMNQMAAAGKPRKSVTTYEQEDEPLDLSQLGLIIALLLNQNKNPVTATGQDVDFVSGPAQSPVQGLASTSLGTTPLPAQGLTPQQIQDLWLGR